jgi:tetratricopeptide (TPR) repeat protein
VVIALVAVVAGAVAWQQGWPPFGSRVDLGHLQDVPAVAAAALDPADAAQLTAQQDEVARLRSAEPVDSLALAAAYLRLGQLLILYESPAAAEVALANARLLAPHDPASAYYLGYLLAKEQKPAEALVQYQFVVDREPENVTALVRLAEIYKDLDQPTEARSTAELALSKDPKSAGALNILGLVAQAAKEPATAVDHWEAALAIQPGANILHRQLASAYRDLGDTARAEQELALRGDEPVSVEDERIYELGRLRKSSSALMLQGDQYMGSSRFAEAADIFRRAVAEDPQSAAAQLNLGAALLQQGQTAEAEAALREALRLEPGNAKARFNLALIAWNGGRKDEARQAFEAVLAAEPGNDEARLALARLEQQEGHCEVAMPLFRSYLETKPEHSAARRYLALCMVQLGDLAGAREAFEAGTSQAPDDPLMVDGLIRILAAAPDAGLRDGSRAVAWAEQLAAGGQLLEAQEDLAMAQAAAGRFDEAVKLQQALLEIARAEPKQARWLPFLEANLAAYQAGQLATAPFPPFAFTE